MKTFQVPWADIWQLLKPDSLFDAFERVLALIGIVTLVYQFVGWIEKWTEHKKEQIISKKTYYYYKEKKVPLLESTELSKYLAERYGYPPFELYGMLIPVIKIWQNTDKMIDPDDLLGDLDKTEPLHFEKSPILNENDYDLARKFIRKTLTETGPIKTEAVNYRMTSLEMNEGKLPKIHGTFGYFYDSMLTKYAMEWEIKKALWKQKQFTTKKLNKKNALPLREAYEKLEQNPILNCSNRSNVISVSTLFVYRDRSGDLQCIICRRSTKVANSPNKMHVVPSGMFEPGNLSHNWSIKLNVWRELLEEVYGDEENQYPYSKPDPWSICNKEPIKTIIDLISRQKAFLSVTGISCDLMHLAPEICTVLFVNEPSFLDRGDMKLNWESDDDTKFRTGSIPWNQIEDFVKANIRVPGFVNYGAICFDLGRKWLRNVMKI